MEKQEQVNFWEFETSYWFKQLNSTEKGLSQKSVDDYHKKYGKGKKHSSALNKDFVLLLSQFKSPLMLLLIGAVIISAFLGDTSDVFIILFIVLATGLMGFFQERNAGKVVEKLLSMVSHKSKVYRDGKLIEIDATEIIVGDLLQLNAGDMIPADSLLVEANELNANEASLTGESYPVLKAVGKLQANTQLAQRCNCLWEGTSIVSGSAKALVIYTDQDTIFGQLAQSATKHVETSFEKGIKDFGYFLMKITLGLSIFILIINLINQESVIESALFALALAVGMAPELLPAITTIAMSAGAKRLFEKKVIVKKLSSIQNLGEVDLLCTDKTGTITEGTITVVGMIDAYGKESTLVKEYAVYNAIYETGYANPIDDALRLIAPTDLPKVEKTGEVPYDFTRKRLSIAVKKGSNNILICKGAFNQIIEICTKILLSDGTIDDLVNHKETAEQQYTQSGLNGLRAIGICYKELKTEKLEKSDETEMIFAGFVLLEDPVKADIIATISELKKLNVGLKIITGDNKNVALAIGQKIGIKNPVVMTGQEMLNTSTEALYNLVKNVQIFAEVEPQQKERVIRALKNSYTVAYIGDGINDVSAINIADVGMSVQNAVDVAKEAADFVLMERNLMVVVDGIKEGRKTFANTLKYIFINTGSTFGNMFSVAIASFILPFLPMLPKQILLTNFITDFPYLTVASDNVDEEQLRKPGKWDLKFIRNYMVVFGIHSSLFDVITFVTLIYILKVKESAFQTSWFIESIATELFILFIIRTHKNFFKSKPSKYLFILSILGLLITVALPYLPLAQDIGLSPLPLKNLMVIMVIVLAYVVSADLLKVWFFKKYRS